MGRGRGEKGRGGISVCEPFTMRVQAGNDEYLVFAKVRLYLWTQDRAWPHAHLATDTCQSLLCFLTGCPLVWGLPWQQVAGVKPRGSRLLLGCWAPWESTGWRGGVGLREMETRAVGQKQQPDLPVPLLDVNDLPPPHSHPRLWGVHYSETGGWEGLERTTPHIWRAWQGRSSRPRCQRFKYLISNYLFVCIDVLCDCVLVYHMLAELEKPRGGYQNPWECSYNHHVAAANRTQD